MLGFFLLLFVRSLGEVCVCVYMYVCACACESWYLSTIQPRRLSQDDTHAINSQNKSQSKTQYSDRITRIKKKKKKKSRLSETYDKRHLMFSRGFKTNKTQLEWTLKAQIRKAEFLTVCEAYKAIFRTVPGFRVKGQPLTALGSSASKLRQYETTPEENQDSCEMIFFFFFLFINNSSSLTDPPPLTPSFPHQQKRILSETLTSVSHLLGAVIQSSIITFPISRNPFGHQEAVVCTCYQRGEAAKAVKFLP